MLLRSIIFFMLWIIYGEAWRERLEKYDTFAKILPMLLLITLLGWCLCIFAVMAGGKTEFWPCLIYTIGYPAVIAVCAVFTRRKR